MGGASSARIVKNLLGSYPPDCQPTSIQFLGNAGGFSGAQIWKLDSPRGWLCVRRWPSAHPSVEQLRWNHNVLVHVYDHGCDFVPVPIPNTTGKTFVRKEGHLWEVTPWMPGVANLAKSKSTEKLMAAMHALAGFHDATASPLTTGYSDGLRRRHAVTTALLKKGLSELRRGIEVPNSEGQFDHQCRDILQLAIPHVAPLCELLANTTTTQVRLQPCLRDIWHDHFLFSNDTVTGLIDFGAMRVDTAAGDLARLLGSLARYQEDVWTNGFVAYQQIRSLSTEELQLVQVFHQANTVLSGLNWVRWLTLEQRRFENTAGVEQRLSDILWGLMSIGDSEGFGH